MNTNFSFEIPKLLLILPLESPSATIYINKPLDKLQEYGYIEFITRLESEVTTEDIHTCDLVIFCRNQDPEYNWILEECLKKKVATIYNLDDNLWEVPEELYYARLYRESEQIKQLEIYLNKVDLVLVYSQDLKQKVSSYNSNVVVAIPCIDIHLTSPVPIQKKNNKIHITYLTGRGNTDPLLTIFSEALLKIIDLYGDRIVMHWWGEIPELFASLPNSRLENINHDYNDFLYQLTQAGYDIGLAPLLHSKFYYSKTNTKFRDYGAAHIAGIYTDHSVYSDVVHRQTGLLVTNETDAWFSAIKDLIDDEDLREHIKQEAYQFVRTNYHQSKLEKQWLDVIKSMLNDHECSSCLNTFKQRGTTPSINLSLGANRFITPGFQCLAKFAGPGVSIIADLSHPLPFKTNSVSKLELLNSFGSRIEFNRLLEEVYRVCHHLAQVSILAPYTEQSNSGNQEDDYPVFNEFTPAEWTQENKTGIDEIESKNFSVVRIQDIDIRCIGYELFDNLLEDGEKPKKGNEDKIETPTTHEKIYYQCTVIKGVSDNSKEFQELKQKFFEPAYVHVYRLRNLNEHLGKQLKILEKELTKIEELNLNLSETRDELDTYKEKNNKLTSEIEQFQRDVSLGRVLAKDLDTFRNRKLFRLIDHIYNRSDLSKELPVTMHKLIDDSLIFLQSLKGFTLKISQNLNLVPHLSYDLYLPLQKLSGIYLAAILDISATMGVLRIEISTHDNQIVAQSEIQTSLIERGNPTLFSFSPFTPKSSSMYSLRIYARNVDIPIRIYEWQKSNLLNFGHIQTKPFMGYQFEES